MQLLWKPSKAAGKKKKHQQRSFLDLSKNKSTPKKAYFYIALVHPRDLLVGVTGLEPATSCTPCMRSSQLSYTPVVDLRGIEPLTSPMPWARSTK